MANELEPRRQDGHLVIYLAWPLLAGLGLATVLAVSVFGVLAIAGMPPVDAGRWAGGTFFVLLAGVTVGVFLYAAADWTGPRRQERIAKTHQTVVEVATPEPAPRFIPLGGRPARLTQPPPRTTEEKTLVKTAIDALASSLTKRATLVTLDDDIESLAPVAPAWVEEAYTLLCGSWPDKLTRREWNSLFDNGVSRWKRWVNGDGSGRHAGRGIFDVWGVIEKADGRGGWRYTQPLDVIFGLDAELKAYANARAGMVKRDSPRLGTTTGPRVKMASKLNQPKNQTNNQRERTP